MPELVRHNRVILGSEELTWSELITRFSGLNVANELRGLQSPVALVPGTELEAFGAVAYLASTATDGLLVGRERYTSAVAAVLEEHGFTVFDLASGEKTVSQIPARAEAGRISLLTSGSTGTPKLVRHHWDTLFTGRNSRRSTPRCWLLPYQLGTYAWYQLVTLGLFVPGQTLVVADGEDLESSFRRALDQGVDSISATPTFWRIACFQLPEDLLEAIPLKNIALGGELADQAILDRLNELFPKAQISHVYASTEAGTCLVVKDGLAGFPQDYLDRREADAAAMKIEEGRLWIRSPYSCGAAAGEAERWLDSGDLVEVRDERVYFVGRANTALINVGGNKAYPADIEAAILSHPAVRWCRVRAVRAPMVGNLPEVDLVLSKNTEEPDESELTRYCAERLPEYAVPRFWNRLDSIPVQSSLKSAL